MEIRIGVNGKELRIGQGLTIADVVMSLGFIPERVAIEHNLEVLKRDSWSRRVLEEGDRLEIVQFVGGGAL